MLEKLSSAPTIFGHRQSQNSTDSQLCQMKKMSASEERLYLQAVQQQAAHLLTVPKSITLPVSALKNPQPYATLWSEGTPSSLSTANESPTFSKECSDPRLSLQQASNWSLQIGQPSKPESTPGFQVEAKTSWSYFAMGKTFIKLMPQPRSMSEWMKSLKIKDKSGKSKSWRAVLLEASVLLLLWAALMASLSLSQSPSAWLTAGVVLILGLYLIGRL